MSRREALSKAERPFGLAAFLLLVPTALYAGLADVALPAGPEHLDKMLHALGFGVLAFAGRMAGWRALPLIAGLSAFGGGIEILQGLTPTRSPELLDFAADAAGAAAGAAAHHGAVLLLSRLFRRETA